MQRSPRAAARRISVRRAVVAVAALIAALLLLSLADLPWSAGVIPAADPVSARRFLRGAFHVHTTRSDGAGDIATVAAAARAAGLQFVVVTDHGDGTRTPTPFSYVDGVLVLDGVEISTDQGHYIAVGIAPSPYPLGGAAEAVAEDVARLGGFGVAAHPTSPRESLRWADESVAISGIEWLNADSEWRDESRFRLSRGLIAYLLRPAAALTSLLDRPTAAMSMWDRLGASRPVLGFAGHDAHGGAGRTEEQPSRLRVPVPSYEASFRTFSLVVELDGALTGDAARDGRSISDRLQAGRFYTEITSLGRGATLEFFAHSAKERREQGSVFSNDWETTFTARASARHGSTMVAYHNGSPIAQAHGDRLEFKSAPTGSYRVEVHAPGAPGEPPVPWLVSNPIFRHPPPSADATPRRDRPVPLRELGWRVEHDPASTARATAGPNGVEFEYTLAGGERRSQFAALVYDLTPEATAFETIVLPLEAGRRMRVSVQLRFARDGGARWGRSIYVEDAPCAGVVSVGALRRIEGPSRMPALARASSLLLVVDLVNARPGDSGRLTLRHSKNPEGERTCGRPATKLVGVH